MVHSQPRTKSAIWLVVLLSAISVTGFLVLRSAPKKSQPTETGNTPPSRQTETDSGSQASKSVYVVTAGFKYQKPSSWAELSKTVLDQSAADSGIGPSVTGVSFITQTSSSTPVNQSDLKTSTLAVLKKLSNFQLLSSKATKISGQSAMEFTYSFGAQPGTKTDLMVVVRNNKTYFLQAAAKENDYNTYLASFSAIFNSFVFL